MAYYYLTNVAVRNKIKLIKRLQDCEGLDMAATINDVAKRAGVSIATVSRVIHCAGNVNSELTRKVQESIEELGYVPNSIAQSLKQNCSKMIGITASDLSVAFFPENPPFVGKAAVFHGEGFIIRFQRADFLTKTFRFPLRIRRLLLQSGKLLLYFFFRTLEQRLFFRRFHTLFSSFHRRFGQTETLLL